MQILYLPEVWHCDSDGSGAAITDFGGARISDELALQKRRIHYAPGTTVEVAVNEMRKYYSEELESTYGVVGIEISKTKLKSM